MYTVNLFTGVGGMLQLLQGQFKTILYCEQNEHARSVLKQRMKTNDIHTAPIHNNVFTLFGRDWLDEEVPVVDAVCGGFPCNEISCLSAQNGGADFKIPQTFYEMIRVANRCKAHTLFLENVSNILSQPHLWRLLLKTLSKNGWSDIRWTTVCANHSGLMTKRRRWFCLCIRDRKWKAYKLHLPRMVYMYDTGRVMNNKYLHVIKPTLAKQYFDPITIGNGTINRQIRLWSCPRTSGNRSASITSTRDLGDLATQLKFARKREFKAWSKTNTNAEFIEFLLGYPSGWSDSNCRKISAWKSEPRERLVQSSSSNNRRNILLGRSCSPKSSKLAYSILSW